MHSGHAALAFFFSRMSAGDDEDSSLLSLLSSASKTTETAAAESHEACASPPPTASPPPDVLKDGTRSRRSESTPDNMTHKIKIYFPDRTYRNILCMPHITAAEAKRKLLSRIKLPSDHQMQLLHAALDGSNFRVIFDSEFLESESLGAEDAASALTAGHGPKTYVSFPFEEALQHHCGWSQTFLHGSSSPFGTIIAVRRER